jgi:hypothetical protein
MGKVSDKVEFVVGYALFFTTLWLLWDTVLVYPVKIFVVMLHEMSHAAAAVATGGAIERIDVSPLQGGVCYCPGGNAFLTLSAGYLGSFAWGGMMFMAARSRRLHAEWVTGAIGALVLGLTLLYVRTPFAIAFGILFGAALLGIAAKATRTLNRTLLLVLGLTSALYAILDIKSDVLDRPGVESDAAMLAELTGIPTLVWGAIWIGLALGVAFLLLRRAYREA